jgi:hypothetical protein
VFAIEKWLKSESKPDVTAEEESYEKAKISESALLGGIYL